MKTAVVAPLRPARSLRHLLSLLLTTLYGLSGAGLAAAQPVIDITAPAQDATLVEGDTVRIAADVSTPGRWLDSAEFYVDGSLIDISQGFGVLGLSPAAVFWTNITRGSHALTVRAIDSSGSRGTSAVTTVNVVAAAPTTLVWTGNSGRHWNTSEPNWTGTRTVFHQGDSVLFTDSVAPGSENVFIGQQPYPPFMYPTALDVSPGNITISNHALAYDFVGGVLRSGSVTKLGTSQAMLTEPAVLSGTVVRGGRLTYYRASASNPAPFGTAPVVIDGGEFSVRVRYISSFPNPIHVTPAGGGLIIERDYDLVPILGFARIDGELRLAGTLRLEGNNYDWGWDELAGPIVIDQSTNGPRIMRFDGEMRITGPIVDGLGFAANGLRLVRWDSFYQPVQVLNSSNTYAGGTVIGSADNSSDSPGVEVGPDSSLGTGSVTVEPNAVLRLLGSRNIHPYASINVQGWLHIADGVEVQVARATLGGIIYTEGVLHAGNSGGYILGEGSLRVVAVPALRLERFLRISPETAYMEFRAAPGLRYTLQAAASLSPASWLPIQSIDAAPTSRLVRLTTPLSPGVANQFYRLRQP